MAEIWYYKQLREYEQKIKSQGKRIDELEKQLKEEQQRRREFEDELKRLAEAKEAKRPKFPDYSLSRQERLHSNIYKPSTGRRPTTEKLKEAVRVEAVYPEGVDKADCIMETTRVVTHLKDGKKEVVQYQIYRQKWGTKRGQLATVLPRSEYGFEVIIALTFLVYTIGVSFDQAAKIMGFFCNLDLKKSTVESLLTQLSDEWKSELQHLADLILLSMIVYMDETGWRVGKKQMYTWIFTTTLHTLLLYGKRRNEEVLEEVCGR
jgi:hypothetical protein